MRTNMGRTTITSICWPFFHSSISRSTLKISTRHYSFGSTFPFPWLLRVGWFRIRVAVKILLEPIDLPIQAFHQVLGLASSRQVVVLARKENNLGRHAVVLQRAKPLFVLLDRHAKIIVRAQNQRRRLHIPHIFERRCIPILIEVIEKWPLEIILMPVGAVARAIITHEIRYRAQRHIRFEPARVYRSE